eukprot:6264284-Amphidinium_carterae.7
MKLAPHGVNSKHALRKLKTACVFWAKTRHRPSWQSCWKQQTLTIPVAWSSTSRKKAGEHSTAC